MESQRANRTRYIVIASRCCYRSTTTERRNKIMRHNSARMSSSSSGLSSSTSAASGNVGTARQLSMDGSRSSTQSQHHQQLQQIDDSWVEMRDKRLSNCSTSANRQSLKCDASEKMCASGDSKNSYTANTNILIPSNSATTVTSVNVSTQDYVGVEESCLLGIDYNERATIGLVVPILADTTIHLDGDG